MGFSATWHILWLSSHPYLLHKLYQESQEIDRTSDGDPAHWGRYHALNQRYSGLYEFAYSSDFTHHHMLTYEFPPGLTRAPTLTDLDSFTIVCAVLYRAPHLAHTGCYGRDGPTPFHHICTLR